MRCAMPGSLEFGNVSGPLRERVFQGTNMTWSLVFTSLNTFRTRCLSQGMSPYSQAGWIPPVEISSYHTHQEHAPSLNVENRLYDLPAHLSDFSPKMIQQSLEKAGFGKCRHWIGGYTLPHDSGKRIASSSFGILSEILFYLSLRKFLFPGVSKAVIAYKRNEP